VLSAAEQLRAEGRAGDAAARPARLRARA